MQLNSLRNYQSAKHIKPVFYLPSPLIPKHLKNTIKLTSVHFQASHSLLCSLFYLLLNKDDSVWQVLFGQISILKSYLKDRIQINKWVLPIFTLLHWAVIFNSWTFTNTANSFPSRHQYCRQNKPSVSNPWFSQNDWWRQGRNKDKKKREAPA